ncbi:MAG: hypothetical protein LBU99_05350 [Spirochaetaceae bacterium]|jgi:hypothetical protein|nr:hypothetical protein [Spirochaetaceae bacterium]
MSKKIAIITDASGGIMKKTISSERVNLFEPNDYIYFMVHISGELTADELAVAVKAAYMVNESTMSRIVLEDDGTAFYDLLNESGCTVTIAQKDWQDIIRENEKIPFNIKAGELLRVFIIPSGTELSLLIMAHHLAGDGKSLAYFLEDVMKTLSGEKTAYKPLRLVTKDYFTQEFRLPLYVRLYPNKFNRQWQRTGTNFTRDDYYRIHETYWREHRSQVFYEQFSPEELSQIKSAAKEMGVTVNSYLTKGTSFF